MTVKNVTVEEYVNEELENARKARKKWANREGCRDAYKYWEGYCEAIRWTKRHLDFFEEVWDLKRRMDDAK